MKVVGYKLGYQDNDSYMFPSDMAASIFKNARVRISEYESGKIPSPLTITEQDVQANKCPLCGYRLNFEPHNPDYKPKKSKSDIGATYDGQTIVSAKFKEFCITNKIEGLVFREFRLDKQSFQLIVTREVKFDAVRRGTRFERLCPVCNNYESVVGAKPTYLKTTTPLPKGIFRSDLLFASGNEKSPLRLVSSNLKEQMEQAGLEGLEFSEAYGLE